MAEINYNLPQKSNGYADLATGLFDMWGLDNAEQMGGIFGGLGNIGTGLFEMYQGNQMMDLYEKNMADQLAHQKASFAANSTQYNNQLLRSQNAGANTEDTRQMIPSTYG